MVINQDSWYKFATSSGVFPCDGKISITLGGSSFIIYASASFEGTIMNIVTGIFEIDCAVKLRMQNINNNLLLEISCTKSKELTIVALDGGGWSAILPSISYEENIICSIDNFNVVHSGDETLHTVTQRGSTTTKVITVGGLKIATGGYLAIPKSLPGSIPDDTWILVATETGFSASTPGLSYAPIVGGKIPAQYLPSFVDDVIEGYLINSAQFTVGGSVITPESGKLYVDITTTTGVLYRWSGSLYVNVGAGSGNLQLGETSSTAYRGDRGKAAYDHSQATGNPHGLTRSDINAAYKNGDANENFSMKENINTRLRIPRLSSMTVPSGLTEGEWYLFAITA